MKELLRIQQELHAPKTQRNIFGKYNYRSCEDILLAVKPLLEKYECVLLMSDKIKELANPYTLHTSKTDRDGQENLEYTGTRVYVEATATIINKDGLSVSVTASAREEVVKKGMDAAQITGATSSYARKYALNGLLCIDDNKDPDATNTESAESSKKKGAKEEVATANQHSDGVAMKGTISDEVFAKALLACGSDRTKLAKLSEKYKLTEKQFSQFVEYGKKHAPKDGTPTAP